MFGIKSSDRLAEISIAVFAALAVFFVVMAMLASPAHADTLKVTTKKDSGRGSLRAAIDKAASIGDTIVFASNVRRTITLRDGELDVDKNLTIKGPGADKLAISGNNDDVVFEIGSGKTVRISGLAITEGNARSSGGGIINNGDLRLTKVVVRDNYADASTGAGGGGGIYNSNVLTLTDSVVSGNFSDNVGGGIYNSFGTLTVQRSTISGNKAAYGGGIYTNTREPEKTTLVNSTISGNSLSSANGAGGGIYNGGGLTEIKNTTVTKNIAPSGQGGGVAADSRYSDDTTVVSSSIIADNTGDAVVFFGSNGSGNPFVSNGYNLIGVGNATPAFNKTGDRVGMSSLLGSLAANGGFTKTHAPLSGSPAIDKGKSFGTTTDQRGKPRPKDFPDVTNAQGGDGSDIGSFEFGAGT